LIHAPEAGARSENRHAHDGALEEARVSAHPVNGLGSTTTTTVAPAEL
jgi:hypothetical protein